MKTADFKFVKTGLSVEFFDLSTGGPVSYLWDFGDGTTSILNSPTHIYPHEGFYTVSLKVEYEPEILGDPLIEETAIKTVGVADVDFNPLDSDLITLIGSFFPPNLNIEDVGAEIPILIKKWQLFLQPLVVPEVSIENTFNQLYWPPLVNYLIAQLVAYDLIIVAANQFLIGVGNSSGSNDTGYEGEVKKIRTGPSEVEWYAGSETWSQVFQQGGTFEQLTTQICSLTHRLRIPMSFCKPLSHNTIVPRVYRKGRL